MGTQGLCLHSAVTSARCVLLWHHCGWCAVVVVLLWPSGICMSDVGYWCLEVDVYTLLKYCVCICIYIYICCYLDCIMTVMVGTVACVAFTFCVSLAACLLL